MNIRIFNQEQSIFNNFLAELRDVYIQNDRMRFRRNLERMGEIMAYEYSKNMQYIAKNIRTPLGEAFENVLLDDLVIASVLRAGLPMHNGILNYFDNADNAFISAYRKHHKDGSFEIEVEYISSPSLYGKVLILSDPMLATGRSMVLSLEALLTKGNPLKIVVMAAIASSEGIEFIQSHLPENSEIYVGAIDNEMTAQAYIVPGLGDAGDLAFGTKD